MSRLIRAGLLTALIDGTFSGVLAQFFYASSAARLFQGVASTLLGPDAMNGGARTALIGVAMHIGVALGWSTVFLLLYMKSEALRRVTLTPRGIIVVAAVYGPMIWLVMSLLVIPTLRHTSPVFGFRWAVQLVGHVFFVGVPIVWSIAAREHVSELSPAGAARLAS
jgi:hypothetical protein